MVDKLFPLVLIIPGVLYFIGVTINFIKILNHGIKFNKRKQNQSN